nr:hypothetical protein [Clostridioides difficile]
MDKLITELSSLGAIGILCALLFKNTMQEKKEDRDMYKKNCRKFYRIIYTTTRNKQKYTCSNGYNENRCRGN